ncbi:MAG: hypothetical protein ACR2PG_03345 [Hyphomicrobiaceae bacterium]
MTKRDDARRMPAASLQSYVAAGFQSLDVYRTSSKRDGIPIHDGLLKVLNEIAAELGIMPIERLSS